MTGWTYSACATQCIEKPKPLVIPRSWYQGRGKRAESRAMCKEQTLKGGAVIGEYLSGIHTSSPGHVILSGPPMKIQWAWPYSLIDYYSILVILQGRREAEWY
jgi:hypothetical protein